MVLNDGGKFAKKMLVGYIINNPRNWVNDENN